MKHFTLKTSLAALSGMAVLAACASQVPATKRSTPPRVGVTPSVWAASPGSGGTTRAVTNDPSAPVHTPLCGEVSKETNRIAAQVYPDSLATQAPCTRNACFDPLTGTFIAATGARSVCR